MGYAIISSTVIQAEGERHSRWKAHWTNFNFVMMYYLSNNIPL